VVTLATAIDQILDELEDVIFNDAPSGVTVARGEAVNPMPRVPILWIYTDTARLHPDSTTLREVWELPVMIVAVTQGKDPKVSQAQATTNAANARKAVLDTNHLELGYVNFIQSTAFEPRTRFPVDGDKFTAGALIEITFTVKE